MNLRRVFLSFVAAPLLAAFVVPTALLGADAPTELKPGDLKVVEISGIRVGFRWCPAGEFMMGSPESEIDHKKGERLHNVKITRGYWLAEAETTQALWKAVMKENPSKNQDDRCPVENVSWNDCQEFFEKIQSYAPDGMYFGLPTEAEWEYACRAGFQTAFWWGDDPFCGNGLLNVMKNNVTDLNENSISLAMLTGSIRVSADYETRFSFDDGFRHTSPVGSFALNAWGFADILGNVYEWCEDRCGAYPPTSVSDPVGPRYGANRIIRGGKVSTKAQQVDRGFEYKSRLDVRSATRDAAKPDHKMEYLGFRIKLADISGKPEVMQAQESTILTPSSHEPGEVKLVKIADVDTPFHWCPPGEFTMGSPEDEETRESNHCNEQQHRVRLTHGFWLCETPVTVAAFRKFVEATGYVTDGAKNTRATSKEYGLWDDPQLSAFRIEQEPSHPVIFVSWNDAQAYVEWLNENYAPEGARFKLPTEAHWEYACRAGGSTTYWWGEKPEDGRGKLNGGDISMKEKLQDKIKGSLLSFDDGYPFTSPVGVFEANAWGLKDMAGNVWEWCEDKYKDYP